MTNRMHGKAYILLSFFSGEVVWCNLNAIHNAVLILKRSVSSRPTGDVDDVGETWAKKIRGKDHGMESRGRKAKKRSTQERIN